MSRRSQGLLAAWADIQRRQQRELEAQRRAEDRRLREEERLRRDAQRATARGRRERQAAYRREREADAQRRSAELEARTGALRGLLAAGCSAPAFRTAALLRQERPAAFDAGPLGTPVPMPDPRAYQVPPGLGFGQRRQAEQQTRARYEYDRRAAQAAEAQRLQQLEGYRQQYLRWAEQEAASARAHNAAVRELDAALRQAEPGAVVEYFAAALDAWANWPEGFPRRTTAEFDAASRRLLLDWELPGLDVVPAVAQIRYMPTADREKEVRLPDTERRALYRDVLAQSVLLAAQRVFAADGFGLVDAVVLSGFVHGADPATGRPTRIYLAAVDAAREVFDGLELARVSAVDCLLNALHGRLSERPELLRPVRPLARPGEARPAAAAADARQEPDLFEMDPFAFEELIARLFRAMGMEAVATQRSHDGGVDVEAHDPDPIRGGRIVVQVKRYRKTVMPSAVRDLYGTVQAVGANKGILITTSSFGRTSRAFAEGKPLTLIPGAELVELLHRHGLAGRLGGAPEEPFPQGRPSVLDVTWSGAAPVDVCALACAGGRVVSEEHFVFYNNGAAPDGSVRLGEPAGSDRAVLEIRFEQLPADADRLVLAAALDPDAAAGADLTGFTGARVRLRDPGGAQTGQWQVSDGQPGETALVLGSFRRRSDGQWRFVVGGKGYPDGLAELVAEYGIDVA